MVRVMRPLASGSYRVVGGAYYGTPKEVWGFRATAPPGTPNAMARAFLRANAELLGLEGMLRRLRQRAIIRSLAATHVILQQQHHGIPIHRAFVTVHIGPRRQVYLAKNRAMPLDLLERFEPRFELTEAQSRRRALRAAGVSPSEGRILPRGRGRRKRSFERRWFPVEDRLRPALRLRVQRIAPREDWIVYLDAVNGRVLSVHDNLALARGVADVFDPNPVVALGDYQRVLGKRRRPRVPPPEAYERVVVRDLTGNGHLDGRRVTTRLTANRVRRPRHDFLFRSDEDGFDEAMAYYHLDRAIRYLESLGYRGRKAIFTEPLPVDAHGTDEDNSWYDPGTRSLTFGTGGVDDAEDAETILHEFGHALQDAICPDFGQSWEAAAIGEGFGDYLAASFFADRKEPPYRAAVMTWDAITYPDHDPPSLRRLDEPYTYEEFLHEEEAEHDNGLIWSATLWEIFQAVGRDAADRIIIESHFQLDGFTRLARAARAIIDADRNLFRGRHVARLRRIFRRRGIGPVE